MGAPCQPSPLPCSFAMQIAFARLPVRHSLPNRRWRESTSADLGSSPFWSGAISQPGPRWRRFGRESGSCWREITEVGKQERPNGPPDAFQNHRPGIFLHHDRTGSREPSDFGDFSPFEAPSGALHLPLRPPGEGQRQLSGERRHYRPPPEDGNERKARGVGRCGKMGAQPQNGAPSLQIEGAGPRIMGFLFNNPKRLPGAPLVAAKGAKPKRSAGNDVARPAQQKGRKRADLLRRKLGCGLCPHRPGKNLGVFARKDLGEL